MGSANFILSQFKEFNLQQHNQNERGGSPFNIHVMYHIKFVNNLKTPCHIATLGAVNVSQLIIVIIKY